jgi:hypothetical protein
MSSFDLIGGVGIMGYLSPMDTEDTYPVTDPLYGVDGLRNVNTTQDLNLIPDERRRAGMIVGVNGGEKYYRLKNTNWVGDVTDWVELDLTKEITVDKETPVGTIDGFNTVFLLNHKPITNSEHIFLNGLLQESGEDYLINEREITFNEAPVSGMRIRCTYRTL